MKIGLQNYISKYYLKDFIIGSLLQNDPEYQIFSLVISIFSEIQILGLTYWLTINENSTDLSSQGLSHTLMKFAESVTFDYFSPTSSVNNLEKFLWVGIILLFLLILDLLLIISFFTKKIYKPIQRIWFLLINFLFSTFFLLVYRLSISHFKQNDDLKNGVIDSYTILSIVFLLFTLPHAYLGAWKSIYPLATQNRYYGFRKNSLNLTGLTLKVVILPIMVLMEEKNMKLVKGLIMIAMLIARISNFIYEIPATNIRVFGLFLIFCVLQLCSSVVGLIVNLTNSLGEYFCHINFIISPILCWIVVHILKLLIKRFAFLNSKELRNSDRFFAKLACIKYILEKGSCDANASSSEYINEYQILYYSIVKEHSLNCLRPGCGCSIILEIESKQPKGLSNSQKKEKILDLSFEIIKENYIDGITHIKDNLMIRLNYAYFLAMGKNQEVINSILAIFSGRKEKLSVTEKLIQRRLIYLLENQLNSKYSSSFYINIDQFFCYEGLKDQFREKINKNVQKYIDFWQSYISDVFEIAPMLGKAEEINNETIEINKIWNEMRKINESSSTEALEYSIYISIIANAPYSARKIENNFYKKVLMLNNHDIEDINNENVDLKSDAFVYFSLKTGKIEHVAFTIDFLGYKPRELVGKNIKDFLLPAMNHYIENLMANSSSFDEPTFIHKTHTLTLYNKDKFISSVSAYIAPVPQFTQDILILCIMRERYYRDDLIALNADGLIEGFSRDFGIKLHIDPNIHKKLKISDICTNYDKINNKSTLLMHSLKHFEATRSSEKNLTQESNQSQSKTKFVKILRGFKHRKLTMSINDLTLTFKPFKAIGNSIDCSALVRKITDSLYILELDKILPDEDEDEDDEGISKNRIDNDSSIDKLFEEVFEDNLTVEYTNYKPQLISEIANENNSRNEVEQSRVRSAIIKNEMNELSSAEGKKKSKTSNEDDKQKKILDFMDSNSVGSRISNKGQEEKYFKLLEEAIYKKKSILSMKILNIAIIIHTIMTILLLVIYIIKSNQSISEIPDIVNLMTNNQQKIYWTYDNYWNGWLELSISQGFLNDGFGYYGQDYYAWLMTYYQSDGTTMLLENNLIRENIYRMSSSIQDYLNEPFMYLDKYTSQERYGNFYQVQTELGNAALSFFFEYSVRDYYPPLDNPDLSFIRANSLNGLLIRSETLFDLLADEGNVKMDFVYNYLIGISVLIICLSLSIYAAIFVSELFYRKEKSLFIDSFLQIRPEQAKDALNMAQDIKIFLAKDGTKTNTVTNFYDHLKRKKHYGNSSKKKAVNYSGLYTKSYFFLFLLLLFQAAIGGILLAINNIFQDQRDQTLIQLKQIANTNKILFKFSSTFLTLYEYINTDGHSFIRYKPLSEEWVHDYNVLVGSYRFFFDIKANDPDIMNQISFLLNGDMCEETFVNDDCSYGIPKQGLLAINSYVLTALSQIKEVYDQSDKSETAKNTALNLEQFRKAETVYFYNSIVAFSMLQGLLQEDIYLFLDKQKLQTIKIVSILSVLMVIFTRLFWIPIWKRFVRERNAFGRFMRIIPFNIILNNGYLKAYLLSYADHILSSIKHAL